ncbi:hypothetical protein MOQ_003909 [Trypanosoma cruzi marinkellei]|uniref:Uncharacterized protein n=1 Tax=Trypanosoma cruzi marinkellei TaxID=85056 RepID=K2MYT7_TRYCR|nr:hypothetical protein MOQ_003909 [Trypanosoma cruzi marinkellei]
MTPRAGNTFTHGGHRAAASAGLQQNARSIPHTSIQRHRHFHRSQTSSSLAMSARNAGQRPAVAKSIPAVHCANTYVCVCVLEEREKKRSTGRHINTARGTAGWQQYMRYGPHFNNHARWQHTPIHKNKTKQNEKTRRQGVAVCVWRCGCLPALAAIKQNKRERNVCSAPPALVARPHATAPSARGASRPLLMRAAGEAHRAVVMSVSVGVPVEQLGGKHTAPPTGRVQQETIKKREE